MNKNIFKYLLSLAAVALMGWSCTSDYFNENYLDGYQNGQTATDVQSIDYTLTEDDYATIAKNATNKALAEEAGEDAVEALAAIGKNKYFGSADEAAAYIPAFLAAGYPTLDDSSIVMVSYTSALEMSEELKLMNTVTEYTLTDDDYKLIWESDEEYAKALTPSTMNKLKSVLKPSEDIYPGEYMVVTYNYSAEEPKSDEPSEPTEPETGYTSVLGSAAMSDSVVVRGYISAVSSQGPILTDNGGSVLLFKGSDLAVGDEVTVTGTISAYNKGFQIAASEATVEKTGTTTVSYPTPVELDGAAMDALIESRTENDYAQFVKFTGTASVGNYINIIMDGATTAQGSIYGATDEVKALFTDGEEATIYGYFCSISSGKYINVVVVSVNEAPAIEAGNNYTSTLASALYGDSVEVRGYISAVSSQGPILTDNSASVLIFKGSDLAVGDEVTVTGTISAYNNGFQIAASEATVEKTGTTTVSYPTPMELTGALMDELLTTRTENEYAYYAKMSGTVSVSGNYYNFNVDGATTAVGSIYGATDALKEQLTDGMECTLYGYFCSISKSNDSPKYINMIVTSVEPAAGAAMTALTVKSEKLYAYFKYDGQGFTEADIIEVQPADYTAMGQGYGNFTNPAQDNYLPKFLAEKLPYAQAGDKEYVAFRCYSGGTTSWKVDEYTFDGATWVKSILFENKTDQFRKSEGVWAVDRTLELDFTNTSSADTKAFYQYCCNWVYDNKDVALGAPSRDNEGVIISTDIVTINGEKPAGNYWVSNYGNNEFYTGASAYYGNMDWRPSAVKSGFAAAGMGDLSDEEILAKLKEHTGEVFAEVLHYVYPEMTPEEYKKVIIKVYAYGPNMNYSLTFDVTEKGKFAYVADSLVEF